jgi:hypothetical protein
MRMHGEPLLVAHTLASFAHEDLRMQAIATRGLEAAAGVLARAASDLVGSERVVVALDVLAVVDVLLLFLLVV